MSTSIKKYLSLTNILGLIALVTAIYSATLFAAKLDLNREQTQQIAIEQKSINETNEKNIVSLQGAVNQNIISINRLDNKVEKLDESYQNLNPQIQVLAADIRWIKEYLQKNPPPK